MDVTPSGGTVWGWVGGDAALTCLVKANPEPSFVWKDAAGTELPGAATQVDAPANTFTSTLALHVSCFYLNMSALSVRP